MTDNPSALRRLIIDGNAVHVRSVEDVSGVLDFAAASRNEANPKGDRPKWTLPATAVERLYTQYAGDQLPAPPMDTEFWKWVDKKVMTDSDFAKYRLGNTSNPFFMGWNK